MLGGERNAAVTFVLSCRVRFELNSLQWIWVGGAEREKSPAIHPCAVACRNHREGACHSQSGLQGMAGTGRGEMGQTAQRERCGAAAPCSQRL